MKARARVGTETRVDIWNEIARFSLGIGFAFAGLIGIWAVACLAGGLSAHGLGGMIRGFITAVTGG